MWLHRLDMALSREPLALGSMVPSRHWLGALLGYFLAPGIAWNLSFTDVLERVLWENTECNEGSHREATSSLNRSRS